jgi:hypothetical protein
MLPPSRGRLIGSRSRKRGKRLALTIADFCNKIGTSRHFAAAHFFGRFRGEADITRQTKPAGPVENDLGCVKTQQAVVGEQ